MIHLVSKSECGRGQKFRRNSVRYWLWAKMVLAEMVMGLNGQGPKWLWAEMTSDPGHMIYPLGPVFGNNTHMLPGDVNLCQTEK